MSGILMVKRGKTLVSATTRGDAMLDKIAENDSVIIDIKNKRSEAQNDLYWAILTKVAPHMPDETRIEFKEQLHVALKLALGRFDLMMLKGKVVPVPHSSKDWSTKKFGEYFDDAMNVLCRDVLPQIGNDDLTAEIVGMLATPAQVAAA